MVGVTIACICYQRAQVDRLEADLSSGRLASDLTVVLDNSAADRTAAGMDQQPEPEIIVDVAADREELELVRTELY